MGRKNWFEVDLDGLAEIAKRRGMAFVVTEAIQNAWDELSKRIVFELTPVPGKPFADLRVEDDSPNGFRDLADSYRMFRTSYKLDNPEQRGRFNIGEKLLLAVARDARIMSTTGSVIFSEKGRTTGRKKTEAGSVLTARLRMTRDEIVEANEFAKTLIPPLGKTTIVNGDVLPDRFPAATGERRLETEVAGDNGAFSYSIRKTEVRVFEPLDGESPHLYEMGIPIDEIDCRWHVEIMQKVPLSVDRSSVRYGFVTKAARAAAELMADRMDEETARSAFASKALEFMDDDDAVRKIVSKRFGDKVVSYDPSAPESNKLALDAGYTVVRGGELSKFAWDSVRRTEAITPAGRKFSDGKVTFSSSGIPPVDRTDWTPTMEKLALYACAFGAHVAETELSVRFYDVAAHVFTAACGGGSLSLNLQSEVVADAIAARDDYWKPGRDEAFEAFDRLLIHEYAHVRADDHLTHAFHGECCRIGARLRSLEATLGSDGF